MNRLSYLLIVLIACAGCGAAGSAPVGTPLAAGLPGLDILDKFKGASVVDVKDIPVTLPVAESHTAADISNNELDFTAPAFDIAWAIWRVTPPEGQLLLALGGGTGALWVIAADYSVGHWVGVAPLTPDEASLDLTNIGDPTSPAGYFYLAVACPQAKSGKLDSLILMFDNLNPYNLTVSQLDIGGVFVGASLNWNSGFADKYKVYRSTIPNDPAPYHLGDFDDAEPNTWWDLVNHDAVDETWVQYKMHTDTPEEDDDVYMLAPAVRYYYHIVPYIGDEAQAPSGEVEFMLDWGNRRASRRGLDGTAFQTHVFADQLNPNNMSAEQIAWTANNIVGTQKIFKSQADQLREVNPDFVVLGYHLGTGAGEIGNICGHDWDATADYFNVTQHEPWFIHRDDSAELNLRVKQQDWSWYVADPSSMWQVYLGSQLMSMLGEDHFDGWFVDSCSEPWNTNPAQWWPDGDSMFGFWTPRLNNMLRYVTTVAKSHPLQPYIIPNAGQFITTASNIKYYGTGWACDGIMVEGHAHSAPGEYYSEADWVLQHDRILDHQHHCPIAILQTNIFTPDTADRLFVYGSYLLVRSGNTYINWLGDDGLDTIFSDLPQWYPEFETFKVTGGPPPPGPGPANSMAEMLTPEGLYRRDISDVNGIVLVNASDTEKQWTCPYIMEKLTVDGGGNVDTDGNPIGSYAWQVINGEQTLPPHTALLIRDILD